MCSYDEETPDAREIDRLSARLAQVQRERNELADALAAVRAERDAATARAARIVDALIAVIEEYEKHSATMTGGFVLMRPHIVALIFNARAALAGQKGVE